MKSEEAECEHQERGGPRPADVDAHDVSGDSRAVAALVDASRRLQAHKRIRFAHANKIRQRYWIGADFPPQVQVVMAVRALDRPEVIKILVLPPLTC